MEDHPAPELDAPTLTAWLVQRVARLLEVDPGTINPDVLLEDHGVASSDAVLLMVDLSELMGQPVSPVVLWDHGTITDLAAFLAAVARGEAELPDDLLDLDFG